eukprot:g15617.t1
MYNYKQSNMTAKEMANADFIKRGAHHSNRAPPPVANLPPERVLKNGATQPPGKGSGKGPGGLGRGGGGGMRGSKEDPFARVAGTELDAGHVWGEDAQADMQMRLALELEAHNVRGDENLTMQVREREDWYEAQGDEKFVKDTNAHFQNELDPDMGWAGGKAGGSSGQLSREVGGKGGKTTAGASSGTKGTSKGPRDGGAQAKGAGPRDHDDGGAAIAEKGAAIGHNVGKQMKGVGGKLNKAAGTMGGKAGHMADHAKKK